jgi:predicted dehydrogenase
MAESPPPLGPSDPSRREFLRVGAAVGLGTALEPLTRRLDDPRPFPDPALFAAPPLERVRVGVVGVGGMGSVHLENLLHIAGVEVRAIGDIVEWKVARAQDKVVAADQPKPTGYARGPRDFERMCQEQELDLVLTATPWEWHVPICLAAMRTGKHAVTEVPAATTVDDCWQLVEAAEKHKKHCVMLENCCYDRRELLALHLVRKGLLGELLHAECGYLHDLREIKFSKEGEGLWRRAWSMRHNGNLYPTHGLGPVAQCLDINRGNRFDYLVSMSSNSRGLQLYAAEHFPEGDARRSETFKLGDINVSLIHTIRGQTIHLVHDTNLPRPYSRVNMLQGTRGLIQGWPDRIYIEGRSLLDQWEPLDRYYDEFEHPLWKQERVRQATQGHGGMDFLELWRLVQCLNQGAPTDMNVYDAAAWSAIVELTERSVAKGSRAVDIPDFTRDRWQSTPPLGIVEG